MITIDDFNRALAATCTERQRVIVQLRYTELMKWRDVGMLVGLSESAALRDSQRAFEQVRVFLEGESA
jgi:DNA-directed RNA polymerase specialized sigma subunit